MNKTLLASGLLGLGLFGCVDEPALGTNQGMSFEEFKAQAGRETGTGFYIVDGDRVISSDDKLYEVWQQMQQGALAIYTVSPGGADIKWSPTEAVNITYCIGGTFNATNKQKIVDAMTGAATNGWELFANVKFVHVTAQDGAACTASNTNVVFDINQVTGQQYLARAFFPNSVRAERNVLVDTTALDPATSGYSLTNILKHELGHTLGFRHEHVRPEAQNPAANACPEDQNFRGVGVYDKLSVMHYPQCNGDPNSQLEFTQLDKDGVRTIYGAAGGVGGNPRPMASISSPTEGQNVPSSFTVSASVLDDDLTMAELYVDGNLKGTKTVGPFTFDVTGLSSGAHTIEVIGTDATGQTNSSLVNVNVTGGSGNGDAASNDITGGCSAGGSGSGLLLGFGLLGLVGLVRRRRA